MPSVAFSSSDGLVVSMKVPVPTRGVMDGVDPAQADWDADFAADLENVRVSSELWQTRAGSVLWQVLPGTGAARLLDNLYQQGSLPVNAVRIIPAEFDWLENSTNAGSLFAGQDLTVCCWVYANTLGGVERTIACEFDVTTSSRFAYTLNYDPGGKFGFKVSRSDLSGTLTGILSTLAPVINTWYFVVGRHDGLNGVLSISINGAASQTVGYGGGVAEPPTPFRVGALFNSASTGSSFWDGRLQTLSVYRSAAGGGGALTDAQIHALYNNGVPLPYGALSAAQKVALVGAWGLGETAGTRADATGGFPLTPHPGSGLPAVAAGISSGLPQTTRLAARGDGAAAQLLELKEGVDASFVSATGGSALGGTSQPLFQGVTNADRFYFTDRAGALRKYRPYDFTPQNLHTIPVASPAAPVAAPGATPRVFNPHQIDWGGGNWSDSNAGTFGDSDDTSGNPPPPPGTQTRLLSITSTAAKGETITHSTGVADISSHSLAFWVRQDVLKATVQFEIGLTSPTDYGVHLRDNSEVADTWYPIFMPVGDLGSVNYVRFRALTGHSGVSVWVTNVMFPGRLEGEYRWIYTHYDSVNQRESAPSGSSNKGQPLDFSAIGQDWNGSTARAFSKSCALRFTSDSGTDTSTDKIRVYRSGGVPSLTIDENGNDLWLRVAEIPDFATTNSQIGGDAAGSTLLHFTTVVGLTVGMDLVLEPGVVGKEEVVRITGVSGTTPGTVNISLGGGANGTTQFSHAQNSVVQIAFLDNVANEQIDLTTPIDIRRDDPPTAARFVVRSPEGRLILMNYTGHPNGIAFSNKPTPDRPNDFEVFPDGVDPLTTKSLTQGFRVDYTGGIAADEEIVWGGYFNGWLSFFTRRAFYVIQANSQTEWGPTSIQKIHNANCIAGDTVQEVRGVLYWVADGPRVMRWGGSGEPECISDLRINVRLKAAPQSRWGQWYAKEHTQQDGEYYKLWYVPSGFTQNVESLQYNIHRDSWEPVRYYDATGTPIGYQAATVRAGNLDSPDLYLADTAGNAIQTEVGNLDGTVPIKVRFATWKIALKRVHPYWQSFVEMSLVHSALIRLIPVNDTATATFQTGGGEYPVVQHSYPINLNGATDHEFKIRNHRDLMGRWLQVTISGDFSNRPGFRDLSLFYQPWRVGRVSKNAP